MDSAKLGAAIWAHFFMILVAIFGNSGISQASENILSPYPETIAVLSMLYESEIKAGYRYQLYAKAALREGHDNIAHLLTATVTKIPAVKCPICHNPVSTYREIPKP